jgi:purine-binding chemotaxis protein CheW
MAGEREDLWQALLRTGESVASESEYEHGYRREIRTDLRRYVTFTVADEIYGLPIEQIVEIATRFETTMVPRTAAFVLGVGNVRGQVMPIIDLPARLALGRARDDRSTRVLIVRHQNEAHGLVVDRVLDVVSMAPEELEDAPGGIGATRADFIAALGRHEGQLVIVLDLDTVLDEYEFILPRFRGERSPG